MEPQTYDAGNELAQLSAQLDLFNTDDWLLMAVTVELELRWSTFIESRQIPLVLVLFV